MGRTPRGWRMVGGSGRTPRGGRVVGGSGTVGHVVVGGSGGPLVTRGEDNPERVPLGGGWRGPSG